MFGKKTARQVAAEIKAAEEKLRDAEGQAAKLARDHVERIGMDLAGGKEPGNDESAKQEISTAQLRVDALRAAISKWQTELRGAIESEDQQMRAAAQATIKACDEADARLKAELTELATKAFALAVQREGRNVGPLIAMRILNGFGLGDYSATVFGWAALKASGDESAKKMLNAVESTAGLPDYAKDRKAAGEVLAKVLNVEARAAELLRKD